MTEGRIFERKVEMRFPGTRLSMARYANLRYEGDDPAVTAPEIGQRRYAAWETNTPCEG